MAPAASPSAPCPQKRSSPQFMAQPFPPLMAMLHPISSWWEIATPPSQKLVTSMAAAASPSAAPTQAVSPRSPLSPPDSLFREMPPASWRSILDSQSRTIAPPPSTLLHPHRNQHARSGSPLHQERALPYNCLPVLPRPKKAPPSSVMPQSPGSRLILEARRPGARQTTSHDLTGETKNVYDLLGSP